jgi:ankyrin repeat protein
MIPAREPLPTPTQIDARVQLYNAASCGNWMLIEDILVSPNSIPPIYQIEALRRAIKHRHLSCVRILIRFNRNLVTLHDNGALCQAAKLGFLEIVSFLLRYGANIHARNEYPLQQAAKYGHIALINLCLYQGANPATDGNIPLRLAVQFGQAEAVRLLLELPEVRRIVGNPRFLLTQAAQLGHAAVLNVLLSEFRVTPADIRLLVLAATRGGHGELASRIFRLL